MMTNSSQIIVQNPQQFQNEANMNIPEKVENEVEKIKENVKQQTISAKKQNKETKAEEKKVVKEEFIPLDESIHEIKTEWISMDLIHPDPEKPRLFQDGKRFNEILKGIKEYRGLTDENAITVRRKKEQFEIIDGHCRFEAAKRMGLKNIPAIVVDLSDEEKGLAQIRANLHKSLSQLEIGVKINKMEKNSGGRGNKGGQKEFAKKIGKSESYISQARRAADVYLHFIENNSEETLELSKELINKAIHLYHISKANKKAWTNLVLDLHKNNWTTILTAKIVDHLNNYFMHDYKNASDDAIQLVLANIHEKVGESNSNTTINKIKTEFCKFTFKKKSIKSILKNSLINTIHALSKNENDTSFYDLINKHIQICQKILNKKDVKAQK